MSIADTIRNTLLSRGQCFSFRLQASLMCMVPTDKTLINNICLAKSVGSHALWREVSGSPCVSGALTGVLAPVFRRLLVLAIQFTQSTSGEALFLFSVVP